MNVNAADGEETRPSADMSEALDRLYLLAKRTDNPMYAWAALEFALDSQVNAVRPEKIESPSTPVTIPHWLAHYLFQVAQALGELSCGMDFRKESPSIDFSQYGSIEEFIGDPIAKAHIEAERLDPKKAMELVPQALHLTREPGWNAFLDRSKMIKLMQQLRAYEEARSAGVKSADAIRALMDALNVSERQARKYVQKGRKISEGE